MTRLRVDKASMRGYVDLQDGDCEEEVWFPIKFEVCWNCDGKGTHVNRAIDSHGISPEEFREDPEFEEAYFSGRYDVSCDECRGERVMPCIDEERCKSLGAHKMTELELYHKKLRDDADYAAECEAERRMGA